tara:strand:- start:116 stop:565 length:450 start_codon:yes stop_codon:yes gene_type:complete
MKNKRGQAANIIVAGIVAVIVGVAMLPIFASLIDDAQSVKLISVEQITNTNFNQTFTLANDDIVVGSVAVINATAVGTPNDLDFSVSERTGKLEIINKTGTWNVSYNYEPDTYVDSATGRTVISNVTLMYAVALILITLASVGITLARR